MIVFMSDSIQNYFPSELLRQLFQLLGQFCPDFINYHFVDVFVCDFIGKLIYFSFLDIKPPRGLSFVLDFASQTEQNGPRLCGDIAEFNPYFVGAAQLGVPPGHQSAGQFVVILLPLAHQQRVLIAGAKHTD